LGKYAWAIDFSDTLVAAMAGDREKCLDGHMDDYISKPLTIPQLGSALERLLKNSKYDPQH
jgi:CheY-like chemotaxis protein